MTDNYMRLASERQAELDAAKQAFFASGGRTQQLEGFKPVMRHRTDWIDPETVLVRKAPKLSRAERKLLQDLANELEAEK